MTCFHVKKNNKSANLKKNKTMTGNYCRRIIPTLLFLVSSLLLWGGETELFTYEGGFFI